MEYCNDPIICRRSRPVLPDRRGRCPRRDRGCDPCTPGRRCRTGTIRDVAREVHLDWKTVKELEQQYMREQCRRAGTPAPKVLGIDEVSIRKRHTYRIVVSDLLRRRPIWFGGRPLGGLGERRVDR